MTAFLLTEAVRRMKAAEARYERKLLQESRSLDREIDWFRRCLHDLGKPAVSVRHQMVRAEHAQATRLMLDRLLDDRDTLDVELGAAGLLEEAGRTV
jgi:hypothetical protein